MRYSLINFLDWVKRYAVSLMLAVTFFIGESHNIWSGNKQLVRVSYLNPIEIPMEWAVKQHSDQIIAIVFIFALFLYGKTISRNRVNAISVRIVLCWVLFDYYSYLYNYKTFNYGIVYIFLSVIWVLSIFGKQIGDLLWQHLDSFRKK